MLRMALFVVAVVGIPANGADPFRFFEPVQPPRSVQVMVHRGLGMAAPENTRRAIEMCIEDYYEWVEIDVWLTSDGKHVVFHDERLDGKSDGRGRVAEQTQEQFLALDGGKWFAPRFANAKLLTLAQALKIGQGKINFYLDCKRIDPDLLAKEIADAGMEKQVIVYDSPAMVARVRAASRQTIPVMTKWRPAMGDPAAFAARHDLAAVEIDAADVTRSVVDQFRKAGVKTQAKVLGATWDNPTTWRKVIAAGAEWLQTDQPLQVLTTAFRDKHPVWPVMVAYHRGANRYAPENTLPAIRLAAELGADYVEIDIRTTKDGQHHLLHDSTLNRTTSGQGAIREMTAAEVDMLDAGAWFGRPYAGVRVPRFEDGLAAMGDKAFAYLDAKDIAPAALATIMRDRNLLTRSVVYQSLDTLRTLKELEPAARAMPALKSLADLDTVAAIKPYAVDAKWGSLSKELIDRCHEKGIRVFSDALGFNESVAKYRQAMAWGIDLIQTDHPARVLRAVELEMAARKEGREQPRKHPPAPAAMNSARPK